MKAKGLVLSLLAVAALLIVVVVFSSKKPSDLTAPLEGQGGPVQIEEVRSQSGTITSINPEAIEIATDQGAKYKITIDANTKFRKIIIPKTLTEEQVKSGENFVKSETLSLADLKIGDKISAASDQNIAGKNEFLGVVIQISEAR